MANNDTAKVIQQWMRLHRLEAITFTVGTGLILGFLWAPTYYPGLENSLDAETAARYGDFVGGVIGTVLLVFSACLLIAAHKQHDATEKSHKEQHVATEALRSFEARFFEMLKYHRDNMTEIDVDGIRGRRAFVSFIREWRLALKIVKTACENCKQTLEVKEKARLAYLSFFHGSGPNAQNDLKDAAKKFGYDPDLVNDLIKQMSEVWSEHPANNSINLGCSSSKSIARRSDELLKGLAYAPFGGHHSRLAHYYRHLYQLVDYVHWVAPNESQKFHVALVTAQLSTHEQALLALHAFSVKSRWLGSPYIDDYDLIADVPEEFIQSDDFPIWEIYKLKRQEDKEV
jgi:hypothetical protein